MSAPVRPDKLDRIEQSANLATIRDREVVVAAPIALALVRVARAARALTNRPFGQLQQRDFFLLREALAELEADK